MELLRAALCQLSLRRRRGSYEQFWRRLRRRQMS